MRRRFVLPLLATLEAIVACGRVEVELEGKRCPCGDGFTCVDGRCLRGTPADAEPGFGGTAGAGGAPAACPAPQRAAPSSLATGTTHTCAIRADGTLWCWGSNERGQLGLGDRGDRSEPAQVGSGTSWSNLAAGEEHTCGTRDESGYERLLCWGRNEFGQLGLGDLTDRNEPVSVSDNLSFEVLAPGGTHTCAIQEPSRLWCWGRQEGGAVGLGVIGPPLSVPARVGEPSEFADIGTGNGHSCAVRMDGSLWCWGHVECWQTGTRTHELVPRRIGERCWREIAACSQHTCGIDAEARLYCWGDNDSGQLGLGFVGGGSETSFGCNGGPNAFDVPEPVMPALRFRRVALGALHTCAITVDGELYCWGYNEQHQVAPKDEREVPVPARVGSATDWVEIAPGFFHTCARNATGDVYCVGDNDHGQQGTGSENVAMTRVGL
ncbi:MAG: hypothetical protein JW751_29165 [Polyangiaceae bacterium]|nr:hypothetical protein [Polyangiaceae bacterium]